MLAFTFIALVFAMASGDLAQLILLGVTLIGVGYYVRAEMCAG